MNKRKSFLVVLGLVVLLGSLWIVKEVKAAYGLRSFYGSIVDQDG